MILAELHSKIPSRIEHKEDILTSNVFSFFKYSNRKYLKDYLVGLGIVVSDKDALNAEFQFWPSYEDGTEPDLVIICGDYYILFEAKLYSDFSQKVIDKEKNEFEHQLEREARMGVLEAQNYTKTFILIAITSEYYKKEGKYKKIDNLGLNFIWTNWQFVTWFLLLMLEDKSNSQDLLYLTDLYNLLINKKLRTFISLSKLTSGPILNNRKMIFYDVKTSMFKGEYSGFVEALENSKPIGICPELYKRSFFNLNIYPNLTPKPNFFYNGH